MINEIDNFIEIVPLTQFNVKEQILLDLNERKITSIQVFNPVMEKKYSDLLLRYKKLYNIGLNAMILEIITHPTENSLSTKTISHKLLYYNITDLKSDCDKLRDLMIKKGKVI